MLLEFFSVAFSDQYFKLLLVFVLEYLNFGSRFTLYDLTDRLSKLRYE